ncbi:MAG: transcription elongation factor GreA [Clostridia bacterium]|nr:transcription elongation factor GreA [Clostridia bacterium]
MAELVITAQGKKELEERLRYLKVERRPIVAEHIKIARDYGDLSENSEYDAARKEQTQLEQEILTIEETLRNARVVEDKQLSKDVIGVGNTITLYDIEFDEELTYKLVGSIESDPDKGYVSNESPIGKALVGKKVGEIVTIQTPGGEVQMKVLKIS